MPKHILNMPFNYKSEDGNCITKCLQEIYQYYNYPITTTKILGITKILDTIYYPINSNNFSLLSGTIAMTTDIDYSRLLKLPIRLETLSFSTVEEGMKRLKELLLNDTPVILFLNPYYLHFTPDYLTTSGGYFGSGHAVVALGFDDETSTFYVDDPTFNISHASVSFKEFMLAWTYTKDAQYFEPLKLLSFTTTNQPVDINFIIKDSLNENIETYYDTFAFTYDDICTFHGNKGFNLCLNDFESCLNNIYTDHIKTTFLENLSSSIFNKVRHSRKGFGLFLKSPELRDYTQLSEYSNLFDTFSDEWSSLGTLLYRATYSHNERLFAESYEKMKKLIQDETVCISELRQSLI